MIDYGGVVDCRRPLVLVNGVYVVDCLLMIVVDG
jgi:hypothetical protein